MPELSAPLAEEVLAPPPLHVAPLTHVRGTLLTASFRAVQSRGLTDRYFAALPGEYHDAMRTMIAGSWVPEAIGTAHYRACEALQLAPQEIVAIGAEVGEKIRATFLGGLLRVAREAGTTPWTFFEHQPRLFGRMCMGGAVAVYKLGPKEARAEFYGLPGLTIPYFRSAFRGANQSLVALFCQKAYVSEVRASGGGDWAYKASWV